MNEEWRQAMGKAGEALRKWWIIEPPKEEKEKRFVIEFVCKPSIFAQIKDVIAASGTSKRSFRCYDIDDKGVSKWQQNHILS